ncbi:GNAT family N-acetyltransferase [Paenibacillaceae bacterium WGS1546]|uniref:GNAT family N-acetyltransferase n=1 Tax=Cohnella sp. WGS1546 TaxID=3366810 RepID=UPI00372D809F
MEVMQVDSGKEIEEISLNQWPALSTMLYDGWLLRFADGYTKRANSISPIYESKLALSRKIEACERIYAERELNAIYKITPFAKPEELDRALADRGYARVDESIVQTLPLDRLRPPEIATVTIDEEPHSEWLYHYCAMSRVEDGKKPVMQRVLNASQAKKAYISLHQDGRIVSCGLGAIERGVIGLYDIVTDEAYRNRGFAEQMILNLLRWGKINGASKSCLAVVANNAPAIRLYAKLGYSEAYRYWYRVKSPLQ